MTELISSAKQTRARSNMNRTSLSALMSVALLAVGCGSATNPAVTGTGFYVSISSMQFSPLDLHVPPGGRVTVINNDSMGHSVTSEAVSGDFTPGAPAGATAFDTGVFTGTGSFTLSSTAVDGTVIPYYCTVHKAAMATPNGTITVDSAAQPGPAPTQTSTGPGYGNGY
jgi:plastocyanin